MLTMSTYFRYVDVDIDNIDTAGKEESAMKNTLATLWKTDARLTALGLLMMAALAATGVALVVDPRVIGGAPAWLKPAKFAASIAIYMPHARVDLHLHPRVAQDSNDRELGDDGDTAARDRDHRSSGIPRHDEPLQRRYGPRRRVVHHHGARDCRRRRCRQLLSPSHSGGSRLLTAHWAGPCGWA